MAIRLLKKLASKLRGDSETDSENSSAPIAGSSARGGAAKAGGSRRLSGGGQTVETWRPGQKTEKAKVKQERKSRQKNGADRGKGGAKPSGPRRSRPKRRADSDVLMQPSDNQADQVRKPRRKPAAASRKPADVQKNEVRPVAPEVEWRLDEFKVDPVEGKTRFHDVDLPLDIMHAIYDLGFKYCTPIQAEVLKHASAGRNIAGQAQTGTGKTAAFLLLTFKQFWNNPLDGKRIKGRPRALVLAPTRELVIQIVKDAQAIGKHTPIRSLAIYGGTGYEEQERHLHSAPVDLIAATPGRLIDFYNKRKIDLRGVEVLVIDEADRMLDMGFIPDVRRIIRSTPPKDQRKTLLFSATLSDDVMRLASQWMPDPHKIDIEPEQVAVDTVKQLVYLVKSHEKFTILYNLLQRPNIGRVLIFANRRDQTERVADELQRHGVECAVLSGAVNQNRRMRVLEDFRSGKVKTVVATDVAGRGLHVDGINHVVNFDLPYEAEDYVHRIGRTGRAGSSGTAVSFACEDESFTIPEIEKYIGEELACKYPEDILLKPLPKPSRARQQQRSRSSRPGGNRGGSRGGSRAGGRSSGNNSSRRR